MAEPKALSNSAIFAVVATAQKMFAVGLVRIQAALREFQ
jgi:hypothetical protein